MTNMLQFKLKPTQREYFNEITANIVEEVVIVDPEEIKQVIKTTLGYNPKEEVCYG